MRYKIYPSIGIARLGQDDDFFVGSEKAGFGPSELTSPGTPVTRFKNAAGTEIRKQAARFHIFQSEDGTTWEPTQLPAEATVEWEVKLINKKSAVTRPAEPPIAPIRPNVPPANQSMVIDGGVQRVSGRNAASAPFIGTFAAQGANGAPYSTQVTLGQLRTDTEGRLIVLGGSGFSSAPPGTPLGPPYYRNPQWHDDVADGPVSATIQLLPDGPPQVAEGGAWVIATPPDFAPEIQGVVTLYDVLRQVGIDKFNVPTPTTCLYDRDIAPLIRRTAALRWVHDDATWSDPRLSDSHLRSRLPADLPLRAQVRKLMVGIGHILRGHTSPLGPKWELRAFQLSLLDSWVNGQFDDSAVPLSSAMTAAGLTQAALEGAVGQGFCPGIEAGIIVLDKTLYLKPFDFRIDPQSVQPGDLTALMAQPWQADFLKCNLEWWPTQRPDIAPQGGGGNKQWNRGIPDDTHLAFVQHVSQLGFIVRQGDSEVFIESERDPAFPPE
jgi:L-Lysine epsilon oxidase N-terminal/L-lysine epsilon oxidase C-terminal domain